MTPATICQGCNRQHVDLGQQLNTTIKVSNDGELRAIVPDPLTYKGNDLTIDATED